MQLVPSDKAWIEDVAGRLLDGSILLLRGLPRSGKTMLSAAVEELLGPSALMVKGKDFTESSQRDARANLSSNVAGLIEAHHCAQLLFDDYGHAIRRSQGGALHSGLYQLLVDGENARDTGALLTCRYLDNVDARFAGSPLLSRAEIIQPPILADRDAKALGIPLGRLRMSAGHTTSLARRLGPEGSVVRTLGVVEYLVVDTASIVNDLPPHAIEVLVNARQYNDADSISRQALLGLGYVNEEGTFIVAEAVRESGLATELQVRNPGWPNTDRASIDAFVDMLAGSNDAIWIDRYLLKDVARLRSFIESLRAHTDCRLRLLSSDDWDVGGVCKRDAQSFKEIPGVEVRLMKPADRSSLHDRQLILPEQRNGFVLPTARVILGSDAPGSAVAVRIPRLPVDYSYFWRRANDI